ncbi:MAG: KUP/HAK/KT family potassium transporter [Thermodesulfovibrionia bacterium]|nr:KUP/HAK/KT family potassium transporter [Thermodesulfovibrionia bacterium]
MTGILKALGLVFGDIGTSPIYTVTVVFILLRPTPDNIIGVMSLIIWTLVILVFLQYNWFAMGLSIRGEGGTIVLKEILSPLINGKKKAVFITILTFIGVSLLIGDGVITPAISILSAVEGSALIPGFENISRGTIVSIAILIAIVLFLFQRKGTEKVSFVFGPIMCVWFFALAFLGIAAISEAPEIIGALNPYCGISFLAENGFKGYIALGEIILCATGGEALYADMGHLGAKPIREAWGGVFFALVLNYLGQGAFLLRHPEASNVLFEMAFHYIQMLYVPFLLLSIFATVIASQAMISGMFSVIYQAITIRIMPPLKVGYTSIDRKSQIYIPSVNWCLLAAVIFIMLEFRASSSLAAAYGLAVTGTMTITGIMITWIFYRRRKTMYALLALFITCVDMVYLSSNFYKIPHGGYWSLILASVPLGLIFIFTEGQKKLYQVMTFMPFAEFIKKFNLSYAAGPRIKGTALFLLKDVKNIPPYITQTMFSHGIMYEENIFISIMSRSDPFGITGFYREDLAKGLRFFEIQAGYMELVSAEDILLEEGIEERAVYYGLEDISAGHIVWRIFSLIKRTMPTFIKFYDFPPEKLHGVITKVRM